METRVQWNAGGRSLNKEVKGDNSSVEPRGETFK